MREQKKMPDFVITATSERKTDGTAGFIVQTEYSGSAPEIIDSLARIVALIVITLAKGSRGDFDGATIGHALGTYIVGLHQMVAQDVIQKIMEDVPNEYMPDLAKSFLNAIGEQSKKWNNIIAAVGEHLKPSNGSNKVN